MYAGDVTWLKVCDLRWKAILSREDSGITRKGYSEYIFR